MIAGLLARVVATSLGRWILGGTVALLLGGAALKWHNFKEDLIHKGQQVCVQEINKQTVIDLEQALADEREAVALMSAMAVASAKENAQAKARLRESESRVDDLLNQQKEQERNDETYRKWASTDLPDGVADRLRSANAASGSSPVREDSN